MLNFDDKYAEFCTDMSRVGAFTTTSRVNGRRTFPLFSTNFKTISTICSYIKDMYNVTTYPTTEAEKDAIHQKNSVVKEFGFRSIDSHNDRRSIIRSDIILAIESEYGNFDNAYTTLITYILLMDIGNEQLNPVINEADNFMNSIPKFVRKGIVDSVKEIARVGSLCNDNIFQQLIVYYGDNNLFNDYIQFIEENNFDTDIVCELLESENQTAGSPIKKRITNCQLSSFKKEAYYLAIFHIIREYVLGYKMKGLTSGERFVKGSDFFNGLIDYFISVCNHSVSWIGKFPRNKDLEEIKRFVSDVLTEEQREEIYMCFKNAFHLEKEEEE